MRLDHLLPKIARPAPGPFRRRIIRLGQCVGMTPEPRRSRACWPGTESTSPNAMRRGEGFGWQPRELELSRATPSLPSGVLLRSQGRASSLVPRPIPPIRTAGVDWASERSARPIETSALGCAAGRAISPPRASSPSRSRQGQRRDSTTPDRGTGRFRRSGTNGGRGRSMARGSRLRPRRDSHRARSRVRTSSQREALRRQCEPASFLRAHARPSSFADRPSVPLTAASRSSARIPSPFEGVVSGGRASCRLNIRIAWQQWQRSTFARVRSSVRLRDGFRSTMRPERTPPN